MPRKIKRSSLMSSPQLAITDKGAAILSVGHATAETVKATGQVTAETVKAAAQVYTATANLVATTVQSMAECGKAYFNYLEECQRTRQVEIWSYTVSATAREHTHQLEIQAKALVLDAREQTRHVEIQAEITMEQLQNVQAARSARMEIVRTFLDEHHRLHELMIHQSSSGLQNLSVDERVHLTKYRDDVLQRLRELESAITTLGNTL